MSDQDLTSLTADIVSAHVSHNNVAVHDVPNLIRSVHEALEKTITPEPVEVTPELAVPVNLSVKHDYIVCLEDGTRLKMLKRYLRVRYNMTPEEYRAKWKLPRNDPMATPAYAETRKQLAKKIGLGRKPGARTNAG